MFSRRPYGRFFCGRELMCTYIWTVGLRICTDYWTVVVGVVDNGGGCGIILVRRKGAVSVRLAGRDSVQIFGLLACGKYVNEYRFMYSCGLGG